MMMRPPTLLGILVALIATFLYESVVFAAQDTTVTCSFAPDPMETVPETACNTTVTVRGINAVTTGAGTFDLMLTIRATVDVVSFPNGPGVLILTIPSFYGIAAPACADPPVSGACVPVGAEAGVVEYHGGSFSDGVYSGTPTVPLTVVSSAPPAWSVEWTLTQPAVAYSATSSINFPLLSTPPTLPISSSSYSFSDVATGGSLVELLYIIDNLDSIPTQAPFSSQAVGEPEHPDVSPSWEVSTVTALFPIPADGEPDPQWACRTYFVAPTLATWPFLLSDYAVPRADGLKTDMSLPNPVPRTQIKMVFVSCTSPVSDLSVILPSIHLANTLGFGTTLAAPDVTMNMSMRRTKFLHQETFRYELGGSINDITAAVAPLIQGDLGLATTAVSTNQVGDTTQFTFVLDFESTMIFSLCLASVTQYRFATLEQQGTRVFVGESLEPFYSGIAGKYMFEDDGTPPSYNTDCGSEDNLKCVASVPVDPPVRVEVSPIACYLDTPLTSTDEGCRPQFHCGDNCATIDYANYGLIQSGMNVTAAPSAFFIPRNYHAKFTFPSAATDSDHQVVSNSLLTAKDYNFNPTIVTRNSSFYIELGAFVTDPSSKFLRAHMGIVFSAIIRTSFNLTFDIVDIDTDESYLAGGPQYVTVENGLNYYDDSDVVISSVSQTSGVLSVYADISQTWSIVRDGVPFRLAGPDGEFVQGCSGFLECRDPNGSVLVPFHGETNEYYPGFTALLTPRVSVDADCGYPRAMIVTCPVTFPEGSEVVLFGLHQAPSRMADAKPRAGRAGAPAAADEAAAPAVAALEKMTVQSSTDPEPITVILATLNVPAATGALDDHCHRGRFDLNFTKIQFSELSNDMATQAVVEPGLGARAADQTFAALEDDNDRLEFHTPEYIENTDAALRRMFRLVADPSMGYYSLSPEGTAVVRLCAATPESGEGSAFWSSAHNSALSLYLGSPRSGKIAATAIMHGYNPNIDSAEIVIDGAFAEETPYLVAPAPLVDYMCEDPATTAEPSREVCALATCSYDLATPLACHFGVDATTPMEECAMLRSSPAATLSLHGCNYAVVDVAMQVSTSGSDAVAFDFRIIPENDHDFAMAFNATLAIHTSSPLNTDNIDIECRNAAGDPVVVDEMFRIDGNMMLVHLGRNFTALCAMKLKDATVPDELFRNILLSRRSVYVNLRDTFPPPVFDSATAFVTKTQSASSAGGDLLFVAPTRGSLAHAPASTLVVTVSGVDGLACSHGTVPSAATAGLAQLFPSTWSDAVASGNDAAGLARVGLEVSDATTYTGHAVRCTGTWEGSFIPSDPVFIGALSGTDGLFYGAHVSDIESVGDITHNSYILVNSPSGATTAASAAAVKALVPAWLSSVLAVTAVSPSAAAAESFVLRFRKGAQMYLPSPRVIIASLANAAALDVVLPEGKTVETVSNADIILARPPGEWGCDTEDDGSFSGSCAAANNCGASYSAPHACVTSSGVNHPSPLLAQVSCAFADPLPALPDYSGCGELKCTGPDGSFIACADSTACTTGCAADLALTPEMIATIPALTPVCVKGGVEVATEVFCPSAGVEAPTFAATCNAKSDCAAVCVADDGNVVACASESAWGQCSIACGNGTQSITYRCADATVSVGSAAPSAVPETFCGDWTAGPGFETERECAGTSCPILVTVTEGPGEDEYTIEWALPETVPSSALAAVSVVADGPASIGGGLSTALGTVPAGDEMLTFGAVERGVLPGNYTAVVTIEDFAPGHSDLFLVAAACARDGGCVNGACNTDTGVCACTGDWSGRACDVSPCDSKGCHATNTHSCSVSDAGVATCNCEDSFTGPLCQTPKSCSDLLPVCAHGGNRGGVVLPDGTANCLDCECSGFWSPESDCHSCGLTCFNNGFSDEACSRCTCPDGGGYHGSQCHCRHAYMTFVVLAEKLPFTAEGAVDADERARLLSVFADSFADDLKTALGATKVTADATIIEKTSPKGKRYFTFAFWVGPGCPPVPAADSSGAVPDSEMLSTYAGIEQLKPVLTRNGHMSTPALSKLEPVSGFGARDPNCQLGSGCPTGWRRGGDYIDSDNTGGGDNPDDNETTPGKKSDLSTGAIVGIAVGGSVFLLALIGTIASACLGLLCFAKKRNSDNNST